MDPKLCEEINELLHRGLRQPVAAWNSIYQLLEKNNLAYTHKLTVDQVLVHPDNRAKMGINAHQAHKTGSMIVAIGADLAELTKSTCFEMSTNEATKAAQVAFNNNLVTSSDGMIAPVTGRERFLSVSASHTTAFCRAAKAQCKTSFDNVSEDGTLCLSKLQKDAVMKAMLQDGWEWKIVSAAVDEKFPQLASLAEKALNAANNVCSECTEMEVLLRIAGHPELNKPLDSMDSQMIGWWDVRRDVINDNPACAPYINFLCTYVKSFSGGLGCPLIKCLGHFGKLYGETRVLGEEFWDAVCGVKFKGNDNTYAFVRH